MPPPRRRMTVPSKTWMRSRLPSTTLADTRRCHPRRAPAGRCGSGRRRSRRVRSRGGSLVVRGSRGCGMGVGMVVLERPRAEYSTRPRTRPGASVTRSVRAVRRPRPVQQVRAALAGPAPAPAPRRQRRTSPWSPADEDVGHVHAPERRRARVLRVLEEPGAERLLGRGRLVDRAGQQTQDGVDDDQRRQLAAGEDVVADRELEVDERRGCGRRRPRSAGRRRRRCGSRGELAAARLAEDLAAGVEQDRDGVRPAPLRRAPPRPAPAAGPCPRRRRTGRRRRCGAGRGPTPAGRGRGSRPGRAPGSAPGCCRRAGPSNIAGNSVMTSISSVMAAAARPRRPRLRAWHRAASSVAVGVSVAVVGRRVRRRGAFGRSGSGVFDFAGRRSSESASTTISPRRGAKTRMKARTTGRSKGATVAAVHHAARRSRRRGRCRGPCRARRRPCRARRRPRPRASSTRRGRAPRRARRRPRDTRSRSVSAASREVTSRKRRRQPGPSATASADAIVSGSSRPSRCSTVPGTKRVSGWSVRTSTRTAPCSPWSPSDEGDQRAVRWRRSERSRAGPARRRGRPSP